MTAPARERLGLYVGARRKEAPATKADGCSQDCTCQSCPGCTAPCEHCSEGCPNRTEAAKAAAAEEAKKPGPRIYKFRANDGEYDRYNDRLNPLGWKLDAFHQNPVILYNHDTGAPGWCSPGSGILPIGKGIAYPEKQVDGSVALMVDIEFDQGDDFAKEIERKVEVGILSAVSVRYIMVEGKYRENERHGLDSDEQELLEISVVTIPGNQRAVRAKDARTTPQVGELLEAVKSLTLALGRHPDLMEKSFGLEAPPAREPAAATSVDPAHPAPEPAASLQLDVAATAKALAAELGPTLMKHLKETAR